VGLRKPDAAIYHLTLERLGLPATECLFLDDIDVNCQTAADLGMAAVRFSATDQALAEVTALLRERGFAGAPDAMTP
jgi:putative hydrolase of the HAD superfamily